MSNRDKIKRYRELIKSELAPLIDSDYALLDVPNHPNIGDNLIWEGELQFLKELPYKCIYSANVHNWDEEKIKDVKIILFHGGGNWGDLYRECQEHRLYITEKFPNKRIIVFPQTVWYNNMDLLPNDSKLFNSHNDIHICVRDQASMNLLSNYIDIEKLHLLPDMAFFVEINKNTIKRAGEKTLFMLRTDSEVGNISLQNFSDFDVKDWPTFSTNKYLAYLLAYYSFYKVQLSRKLQHVKILSQIVNPMYGLNNRNNRIRYIQKGIDFFSNYDIIYTTRLHGLILGILMEKKMVIVDNKYNKCRNYFDTWLRDFSGIDFLDKNVK